MFLFKFRVNIFIDDRNRKRRKAISTPPSVLGRGSKIFGENIIRKYQVPFIKKNHKNPFIYKRDGEGEV